jgi:TatD DNase family protein
LREPFPLVDAHCHLADERLRGQFTDILDRALAAGIGRIFVNGTCPEDWPEVLWQAESSPHIVPFFGLHPWKVGEVGADWLERLTGFLEKTPSGVGEIGLDRWIEPRDEALQERCFLQQWQVARERNLPCTVHCLRAWGWFMQLLERYPAGPKGFLLHSYGGPPEMVRPLAQRGAWFSFSAMLLEKRRDKMRAAFREVPEERLLLETDAPDNPFPPENESGPGSKPALAETGEQASPFLPNEPAHLPRLLPLAAALRETSEAELAALTTANAKGFLAGISL